MRMYEIRDIFWHLPPCHALAAAMENGPGVFADIEEFVAVHGACGSLTGGAGDPTAHGYFLSVTCSCGAIFERWVTPEAAEYDLLRSRLLTSQD